MLTHNAHAEHIFTKQFGWIGHFLLLSNYTRFLKQKIYISTDKAGKISIAHANNING